MTGEVLPQGPDLSPEAGARVTTIGNAVMALLPATDKNIGSSEV